MFEQGQGLTQPCRRWGDDAVKPELVGGETNLLARLVGAIEIFEGQTHRDQDHGITQVKDVPHLDLARENPSRPHPVTRHPLDIVDEMPVSLDDDRVSGPTQV